MLKDKGKRANFRKFCKKFKIADGYLRKKKGDVKQ